MKSRLWVRAFVYAFIMVAGCALAISLYSIPLTRNITFKLEEQNAIAMADHMVEMVETQYREIQSYRDLALEAKMRELKNITEVVGSYIMDEYKAASRGEMTEDIAQKRVLENVHTFRYGNDDYFWISNYKSVLISHPDPKLYGADFSNVRDVHDNLILPPMVEVARMNGEGYTSYWWNRLGKKEPSEKLTYSRLFVPWDWVYGTGVYIDDIDEEVARRQAALIEDLRQTIDRVRIARTGYMFIFDDNMRVIAHPDKDLWGADFKEMIDQGTGKSLGVELVEAQKSSDGLLQYLWNRPDDPDHYIHKKIGWVRFVPGFDWYIASSVYEDELHEVSRELTWRVVWITLIVLAISMALAFYFLKRLIKPIEQLSGVALKVQAGNLNVRSGIESDDEIGILAREFDHMVDKLQDHLITLDAKVQEKTQALSDNLEKLSEANRQIIDSIEYARNIQRAILPQSEEMAERLDGHFVVYEPREIIGGDFYWFTALDDGFLLAVADCTGHGVPGAVMTMIAATSLRRAVSELGPRDPALILKRLNRLIKRALHQNLKNTSSDDGLDIGLIFMKEKTGVLTFAGAKMNLIHVRDNVARDIRGDRMSIGYKTSDLDHDFCNHRVEVEPEDALYLATDGVWEQTGGEKGFPLGWNRFLNLPALREGEPFETRKHALMAAWSEFKGEKDQRDDVTILGFKIKTRQEYESHDDGPV